MLILLLLLGAVVLTGGVNVIHPFLVATRMRVANDALEQQVMRLKIQNQSEVKAIHALEEPGGIELVARKYGYIYRTENRLQVP